MSEEEMRRMEAHAGALIELERTLRAARDSISNALTREPQLRNREVNGEKRSTGLYIPFCLLLFRSTNRQILYSPQHEIPPGKGSRRARPYY